MYGYLLSEVRRGLGASHHIPILTCATLAPIGAWVHTPSKPAGQTANGNDQKTAQLLREKAKGNGND